jgi:ABC-type nitrate/sulfonate/bicarbonate transport system substrate-binding protein
VALSDAAPLIVAEARGFFTEAGLDVELHREIGWATIRDKIIYGELDAAHAPAPMLWSAQLGINCPPCDVLTALVLNLNGNAITLSAALREAGVRDDRELRKLALERRARQPLTFGVVFPYSSHHLLLRSWLRSADIDPDRDVRIVVVPPGQMFRNIAARTIDGFCAGEPWNSLAVREDVGWCRLCSAVETPGHVEKVLMVRSEFAVTHAAQHAAMVTALMAACAWCDEPQNRGTLAELLSEARYLNMPARTITPAITGHFDFGHGVIRELPDFHVFHRGGANVPSVAKAEQLQSQLASAGLLPAGPIDPSLPRRLFREDLHRDISHQPTHHAFAATPDLRGVPST